MKCCLCGLDTKLCESHIVPHLVYRRIQEHPRSRFRNLNEITKVLQDGEKYRMLCRTCENKFSKLEVRFANHFLDPYLESEKMPSCVKEQWFQDYIASVAWRILHHDLFFLNSFAENPDIREMMIEWESDLREYFHAFPSTSIRSNYSNFIFPIKKLNKTLYSSDIKHAFITSYSQFSLSVGKPIVLAYYAGLLFITIPNYDNAPKKNELLDSILKLMQKAKIKKHASNELEFILSQFATLYQEKITEGLREKINKYYNK